MSIRSRICCLLALFATTLATPTGWTRAATLLVGTGQEIGTIAAAARRANDGDVVAILPGTYEGDVSLWLQKSLTIRGVGERPVIDAAGKSAEGKAIWVFRNGDFTVENIEFRNARVPDGNGAGIRFEHGSLTVANCKFANNQMGLLSSNDPEARLTIIDSEFSDAPRTGGRLHHLLYVGRIARFVLQGSHLHGGFRGHLVKSRARETDIRYNLINDGPGGEASYEVEMPDGGDAILVGNIIAQSAGSQNPIVVAYGAEGTIWPVNRLVMSHNTLVNESVRPAWFARVWQDPDRKDVTVVTRNNLTVGFGAFTLALHGDHSGNLPLLLGRMDPDKLDFALDANSWLRGLVTAPIDDSARGLLPIAEFRLPAGTRQLLPPASWAPGAIQTPREDSTR